MPTRISDVTRARCAEAWPVILEATAQPKALTSVCAELGLSRYAVYAYMNEEPERKQEYENAYDAGTEALMDEHLDTTRNSDADHNRTRATLNGLQFQIEKRNPGKYGQRSRVDVHQHVDFAGILQRANARLEQLRAAALTAEDAELVPSLQCVRADRDEENQ